MGVMSMLIKPVSSQKFDWRGEEGGGGAAYASSLAAKVHLIPGSYLYTDPLLLFKYFRLGVGRSGHISPLTMCLQ